MLRTIFIFAAIILSMIYYLTKYSHLLYIAALTTTAENFSYGTPSSNDREDDKKKVVSNWPKFDYVTLGGTGIEELGNFLRV